MQLIQTTRCQSGWRGMALFLLVVGGIVASHGEPAARPSWQWSEISAAAGGGKGAAQLASGDILTTRMRRTAQGVQVVCARSVDGGRHWQDEAVIASETGVDADLGDGHLLALPTGEVLYSYRHNRLQTNAAGRRTYSIRVAVSRDAGQTWQPHSVVAQSTHDPVREPEALRGLWSSFLLRLRDGTLHCYYDDEDTPHRRGFFRHQWLTRKTWDAAAHRWRRPVTVSRALNARHLSRDGMPSVVELPSGRLLCVMESVQTAPPHANCLRAVTSDNGGRTWSWRRTERAIVYAPQRENSLAVSPWLARLPDGRLLCVFTTDEERDTPSRPGTPPRAFRMDVKCLFSDDNGQTWPGPPQTIFAEAHHNYAPGALVLRDGSVLVTCMSFDRAGHRAFRGVSAP